MKLTILASISLLVLTAVFGCGDAFAQSSTGRDIRPILANCASDLSNLEIAAPA